MSASGPTLPSPARDGHSGYPRISCRQRRSSAMVEDDPELTFGCTSSCNIEKIHVRGTGLQKHRAAPCLLLSQGCRSAPSTFHGEFRRVSCRQRRPGDEIVELYAVEEQPIANISRPRYLSEP